MWFQKSLRSESVLSLPSTLSSCSSPTICIMYATLVSDIVFGGVRHAGRVALSPDHTQFINESMGVVWGWGYRKGSLSLPCRRCFGEHWLEKRCHQCPQIWIEVASTLTFQPETKKACPCQCQLYMQQKLCCIGIILYYSLSPFSLSWWVSSENFQPSPAVSAAAVQCGTASEPSTASLPPTAPPLSGPPLANSDAVFPSLPSLPFQQYLFPSQCSVEWDNITIYSSLMIFIHLPFSLTCSFVHERFLR